jgi:pimeloyl-ACP methyl ester carboxylesterase
LAGSVSGMTTTTPTRPLVLVAGAGLGGWAFARMTPALRAAGHDVHPVTLTGTGDRAHLNGPHLDLSAWVTDVVAHLETEELTDVVLVGHSFGGVVTTAVAERAAGRLARLVYLDAVVPADGDSAFSVGGAEFEQVITALVEAHDGWSLPWFTDEQLDTYYGDHALTAADLRWIRRHVTPQPVATLREAVVLREPAAAALPRTYVRCTGTPGPPMVAPGTPGWDDAELATGHWPMITAPEETAALLAAVAEA